MAIQELSTVFHNRGNFRKKFLEEIGWRSEDLRDFQSNLQADSYRPESLFLDFFVNGFTGTPDSQGQYRNLVWWRERAPSLGKEEWFFSAIGYALALQEKSSRETLLVDFWERELDFDYLPEVLFYSAELAAKQKTSLQWICWSASMLANWQQEGLGEAELREERMGNLFSAQGLNTLSVPVTDPLGALLAGRRLAASAGTSPSTVVILPSFTSDKLVQANWSMKTVARYSSAMEAVES